MEHDNIKKNIEELLRQMNIVFESVDYLPSEHPRFTVRTSDSAALIGVKGENLMAFNYIARRLVAKATGAIEPVRFFIDVNGYQEKALENLKAKAKVMCERAKSFKVDIELEPMSSYERMLVHSYLEGEQDVKTESKGEGASRGVVIKYIQS